MTGVDSGGGGFTSSYPMPDYPNYLTHFMAIVNCNVIILIIITIYWGEGYISCTGMYSVCMHKYNLLEHMYNRYHINTMLAGGGLRPCTCIRSDAWDLTRYGH